MKKIIPIFIILFVFTFIITAGVLIVKTGLTNNTSNAKLIGEFFNSDSMSTKLADADSGVIAQPKKKITVAAKYIAPLKTATATAANTSTVQALELQAVVLIREQMALQQSSH